MSRLINISRSFLRKRIISNNNIIIPLVLILAGFARTDD